MLYNGSTDRLFFTADLHFFHDNIIDYCGRPFKNSKEMNKELVDNWNSTVKSNDIIVVVGDLSIGRPRGLYDLVKKLRGRKILVLGNHDDFSFQKYLKMGFESVHTFLEIGIKYSSGVDSVYVAHDSAVYNVLESKYDNPFMVCGHVHTFFKSKKGCVNCGVDIWDFKPVSYDILAQEYNESINKEFEID